ncbi:MAG: hypothetical protein ACREV0_14185 [Burkholderiales bacterium]
MQGCTQRRALSRPLNELEDMLLKHFAGQTLTFREIYKRHNVDRPYIERNYKDALLKLEAAGAISTAPPASDRRKGTFGPKVTVKFPRTNNRQ